MSDSDAPPQSDLCSRLMSANDIFGSLLLLLPPGPLLAVTVIDFHRIDIEHAAQLDGELYARLRQ